MACSQTSVTLGACFATCIQPHLCLFVLWYPPRVPGASHPYWWQPPQLCNDSGSEQLENGRTYLGLVDLVHFSVIQSWRFRLPYVHNLCSLAEFMKVFG